MVMVNGDKTKQAYYRIVLKAHVISELQNLWLSC